MDFINVANLFQVIEKTSSRNEITVLLADFLKELTFDESAIFAYMSLGSLRPSYKKNQFSIAKKQMIKVISKLLSQVEDYIINSLNDCGDLGQVVFLSKYEFEEKNLTIIEVYNLLSDLENISGSGSQEKKIDELCNLLRSVEPVCSKYIIKIILGNLRLGFSDMTFLDSLSFMKVGDKSLSQKLEDAYNICADIGLIAKTFKIGGIESIENMKITTSIPIRPSAAERLKDSKAIIEKIGKCAVQPKLDGFRIQVHIKKIENDFEINFFSRNLLDMSDMFPDLIEEFKTINVDSLILEGEAIAYDRNSDEFVSFQETVRRKRKHDIDQVSQDLPLRFYAFDILYLNGKSLLNESHISRRLILKHLIESSKNLTNIILIDEKTIDNENDFENYFVSLLNVGLEGVVAKKLDSIYQPGKRNFNWIKLKYHATNALNDTIDVVILGYYPGYGKRSNFGIGAFLVGIFNEKTESFETIAKIGTGLFDQEWIELKNKCDQIKILEKPKNVICDKTLFTLVWVEPSIVCEVRADQITKSTIHSAANENGFGVALRFPRFICYRNDKNVYQTTTAHELKKLV